LGGTRTKERNKRKELRGEGRTLEKGRKRGKLTWDKRKELRGEGRTLEKRRKRGKLTWDKRKGQTEEREIDLGQEERTERRGTGKPKPSHVGFILYSLDRFCCYSHNRLYPNLVFAKHD
jgi:hypothetical protein